MKMRIQKIVSGGQTGADRAALDWAIANGVGHGGWCPEGRLAEDGAIPLRYLLTELPGAGYRQRTKANVRDSDGTLIVSLSSALSGGSLLTVNFAKALKMPWLHVHPGACYNDEIISWVNANRIHVLNVAGPRESKEPGIGGFVLSLLDQLC
jgi:hypothetical protein